MRVEILFMSSSTPKVFEDAESVYTKDQLLCVRVGDYIYKYPLTNIFSVSHLHGPHLGSRQAMLDQAVKQLSNPTITSGTISADLISPDLITRAQQDANRAAGPSCDKVLDYPLTLEAAISHADAIANAAIDASCAQSHKLLAHWLRHYDMLAKSFAKEDRNA